MKSLSEARVAIVHEWLVTYAGSERVLEQMLKVFPQADLFSLVDFLPDGERGFIQNKPVRTSFIQKLPKARTKYRSYLPLMPLAVEQFDLSAYDIVISSSHCVAKGVLTGPDTLHLCMCYSPVRYAWDLQHQYLKESGLDQGLKSWLARYLLHRFRQWDMRTAAGVDRFIAISNFIARRIEKVYRRDSAVIYPPVSVNDFPLQEQKEDFYLVASRLVPYKKVDLIVEAFARMPEKRLVVIGDGPDAEKVQAKASPNVQVLGYQSFEVLRDHMRRAKAFVFAAEEDFGIVVLEAQACGTPVVAYGKGGALETVNPLDSASPTGEFFYEQTVDAIQEAVSRLDASYSRIDPSSVRGNAQRFGEDRFRSEFRRIVEREWSSAHSNSRR